MKSLEINVKGLQAKLAERRAKQEISATERNDALVKLRSELPKDEIIICEKCQYDQAERIFSIDESNLRITSAIECSKCSSLEDRLAAEEYMAKKEIPSYSFEGYEIICNGQRDALSAAREFANTWESRWICFCGKSGTGKGHLSGAIIRKILAISHRRQVNTRINYYKHIRLIRRIRSTFQKAATETEQDVISEAENCELLYLDEVGLKTEISGWEKATIEDLLDSISEHGRSLIMTSNLSPGDLFDFLGERIRSRFSQVGKVIVCDWEDYRKTHRLA